MDNVHIIKRFNMKKWLLCAVLFLLPACVETQNRPIPQKQPSVPTVIAILSSACDITPVDSDGEPLSFRQQMLLRSRMMLMIELQMILEDVECKVRYLPALRTMIFFTPTPERLVEKLKRTRYIEHVYYDDGSYVVMPAGQ